MEPRLPKWVRPAAIGVAGVLLLAFMAATWAASNAIRDDFLAPQASAPDYDLEVLAVGGGRIVLPRTPQTEQEGIWGLDGEQTYGQLLTIVAVDEEWVERGYLALEGDFSVGDRVRIDQYAYSGDPDTALAISFDDLRIVGQLGSFPAWFVDGDRDLWVISVHGRGIDERRQVLRILPMLVAEEVPVLAVSYRNDRGAPGSPSGLRTWGPEEWPDVEAAVQFAVDKGADEVVLLAYGLGAEVVSIFLHESDLIARVRGAIFDSPVLDLEAAVERRLSERGFPGFVRSAATAITRLRYGVEWKDLDQVARSGQFDVPILLLHGSDDGVAAPETAQEFAAIRSDLVTLEIFAGAGHELLWNADRVRYERLVREFLGPPPE
jgi:pimeloyl-ACP methyl ester carboxylesterase